MVSRRPADPSVPIVGDEILRTAQREIRILVASYDDATITEATYAAGERIAAPHVHDEHTDVFYVLDGELTFEIGREATTIKRPMRCESPSRLSPEHPSPDPRIGRSDTLR